MRSGRQSRPTRWKKTGARCLSGRGTDFRSRVALKNQAALRSFKAFSKASLIGLDTFLASSQHQCLDGLGLLSGLLDLFAQECALQFEELGRRLHGNQSFEVREAGFGIGLQSRNRLQEHLVAGGLGHFTKSQQRIYEADMNLREWAAPRAARIPQELSRTRAVAATRLRRPRLCRTEA